MSRKKILLALLLLSVGAAVFIPSRLSNKIEGIILNGGRYGTPDVSTEELLASAQAGNVDGFKKLLTANKYCVAVGEAICNNFVDTMQPAFILIKQLLARNENDAALDLAFYALHYDNPQSLTKMDAHNYDDDFFPLIASLDYRTRLHTELEKLYANRQDNIEYSPDADRDPIAWVKFQMQSEYNRRIYRLLMIPAADAAHIQDIQSYFPPWWSSVQKANLFLLVYMNCAHQAPDSSVTPYVYEQLQKQIALASSGPDLERIKSTMRFWPRYIDGQILPPENRQFPLANQP